MADYSLDGQFEKSIKRIYFLSEIEAAKDDILQNNPNAKFMLVASPDLADILGTEETFCGTELKYSPMCIPNNAYLIRTDLPILPTVPPLFDEKDFEKAYEIYKWSDFAKGVNNAI